MRHSQILSALEIQRTRGGMVGRILTEMGACCPDTIARALLRQSPYVRRQMRPSKVTASQHRAVAGIKLTTWPMATVAVLVAFDLVFFLLSGALSLGIFALCTKGVAIAQYASLWPVILLFFGIFLMQDLYWVAPQNPVDELRGTTISLTSVYFALAASTFLLNHNYGYSRALFLISWLLAIVFVPLGRALVRSFFSSKQWWGHPVVVISSGEAGPTVVRNLRNKPKLGMKPMVLLDETAVANGRIAGVPVLNDLHLAPILAKELNIKYAVVAMPECDNHHVIKIIEKYASAFPNVVIIPNLLEYSSLQVPCRDMGGMLGLCIRQRLLKPFPRLTKRTFDLIFTLLGGAFLLPILLVIALLIKLDSRGKVLYTQKRLGKNGRHFKAYKFRTMHGDGEQRLKEILDSNPELRKEYDEFHKLNDDPRVTKIGYYLRKFSLDEFPQLWNVLRGDMSLVGPRPYLEREIPHMNEKEAIILKCMPGLTGLWQVGARNGASFSHRIHMDVHYVRNWSLWLDAYLLASTFSVVVKGTGS